jgi:hypothetical protein
MRLTQSTARSHQLGFEITSARQKLGHSTAACATSPHNPQPTHSFCTCATGLRFSGSAGVFTVSVGQPDSRMQEWSPVQVDSSTP